MAQHDSSAAEPWWGYKRDLNATYKRGRQLGRGGNASVVAVQHRGSGQDFACKVLPKALSDAALSAARRAMHAQIVRNEIEALQRLRGTLSVAALEDVFEDEQHIYLIVELCRGGDLIHHLKGRPFDEQRVAAYMQSVLRALAQCHAVCLLHRDVKPENFMLSGPKEDAHVKAIDFGSALPFDPQQLPLKVSVLEGTPWYLAPEACKGSFWPASDVWAAGVLTAQLLTGNLPFTDRQSPAMPSVQRVLWAILREEVDYQGKGWERVSPTAVDFVSSLLHKDPAQRPSAAQALEHPWIQQGSTRAQGALQGPPIDHTVVQRLQRFAQADFLQRSVLEHIAADMLALHTAAAQQPNQDGLPRLGSFLRLPPGSEEGSARSRSSRGAPPFFYGRSVHGGSVAARTPDPSVRYGSVMQCKAATAGPAGEDPGLPGAAAAEADAGVLPPIATPHAERLQKLLRVLQINKAGSQGLDRAGLEAGLARLGYDIAPDEVERLIRQLDTAGSGRVTAAELAAGIIDWTALQGKYKELWLLSVRHVFEEMDTDGDGRLDREELMGHLAENLQPQELDLAARQVLVGADQEGGLDLAAFAQLLLPQQPPSLSLFEARVKKRAQHASPAAAAAENRRPQMCACCVC